MIEFLVLPLTPAILPPRFGLVGDVHAEDDALELALGFLKAEVGTVLCTGDIADGYGSVDRACALLREHGVVTVRGNHDRWLLTGTPRDLPRAHDVTLLAPATRSYLETLPVTLELQTPAGLLLLCHGLGTNDMAKVRADDFGYAIETNDGLNALIESRRYGFVANGHTHHAMVRGFGALTVINAGTLHRHDHPGFLVVDLTSRRVRMLEISEANSIEVVNEVSLPAPSLPPIGRASTH